MATDKVLLTKWNIKTVPLNVILTDIPVCLHLYLNNDWRWTLRSVPSSFHLFFTLYILTTHNTESFRSSYKESLECIKIPLTQYICFITPQIWKGYGRQDNTILITIRHLLFWNNFWQLRMRWRQHILRIAWFSPFIKNSILCYYVVHFSIFLAWLAYDIL